MKSYTRKPSMVGHRALTGGRARRLTKGQNLPLSKRIRPRKRGGSMAKASADGVRKFVADTNRCMKAKSFPRTVTEALLRGFTYPGGCNALVECNPAGGLGGFEHVTGEVVLYDTGGNPKVAIPFKAKLDFGKPKPA
jgi:hypothetical protein